MKKLYIVGTGTTVNDIDWNDPDHEIWGTGTTCGLGRNTEDIKRIDRIFEIHHIPDIIDEIEGKRINYKKFPVTHTYVQNADHPYIKEQMINPVTFPLQDVIDFVDGIEFFGSTFDYMLIYAAMQGFKEIYLHKIMMYFGDEYFIQRPSALFWIRYLTAKYGVKIIIPDTTAILDKMKYGYDDNKIHEQASKLINKEKWLWEHFDRHNNLIKNNIALFNSNYGKLELLQKIEKDIAGNKREKLTDEIRKELAPICEMARKEIINHNDMANQIKGALQVTDFYKHLFKINQKEL